MARVATLDKEVESFAASFRTKGESEPSQTTRNSYRHSLNLFFNFLHNNSIAQIDDTAVAKFKESLFSKGLKSSSIARHVRAIKAYFRWKGKECKVTAPSYKLPAVQWLKKEQIEAMVNACKTPLERCVVIVLYDTGMRIGELLNVKLSDIDFTNGYIHITRKGDREGDVPIYEASIKALKDYLNWRSSISSNGKVFPYTYWEVRDWLNTVAGQAGIKSFHPHMLRHSKASAMRLRGIGIEDIKDWLGHASIETTMRYSHILPADLKKKVGSEFK